jgi:hypothetical protein
MINIRIINSGSIEGRPVWLVIGLQFSMQPAQIENRIDPAHQMIGRDHLIKAEIMEKTVLVTFQPPHHHAVLLKITKKTESHSHIPIKKEFCNSIGL